MAGLEPATFRVWTECSSQLSHIGIYKHNSISSDWSCQCAAALGSTLLYLDSNDSRTYDYGNNFPELCIASVKVSMQPRICFTEEYLLFLGIS